MKKSCCLKNLTRIILFLVFLTNVFGQTGGENFVTDDIDNFWNAYDKITATTDSTEQFEYLNKLFIEKGSPGLKAMMKARRITDKTFIEGINKYPLFWNSVRANTFKAKELAKEIEIDVEKIRLIYPELKPAKIYFTFGALRSNGTTMDDMVLIGSETALADKNTVSTEFPREYDNLRSYFATDTIDNIVQLTAHEYVHTQQKTTVGNNLLAQSVLEGVAEFVANTATGRESSVDAFTYGKQNNERVREKFMTQMFNEDTGFWLYENADNEFKTRDLGYYVGNAICEGYYKKSIDKKQAIKEMIELDYNNEAELENFVQKSGYFNVPIKKLKRQYVNRYEKNRPKVVGIKEFKNESKNVSADLTQITINFSAAMNKRFTNFNLGPLGKDYALSIKKLKGFSEDGKSLVLEIELKPDQKYQLVVDAGFRNENGIRLKPYLINFKTAAK